MDKNVFRKYAWSSIVWKINQTRFFYCSPALLCQHLSHQLLLSYRRNESWHIFRGWPPDTPFLATPGLADWHDVHTHSHTHTHTHTELLFSTRLIVPLTHYLCKSVSSYFLFDHHPMAHHSLPLRSSRWRRRGAAPKGSFSYSFY